MVGGTFFPHLPGGVRAYQDGLGHFFMFASLTEGGGGLKLYIYRVVKKTPCRPSHFKKGFFWCSEMVFYPFCMPPLINGREHS